MKTQISKQHTYAVAIQPLTTFHKEDRMKKQSLNTLKLAILFAMVLTMALSAVAQNEVVGPPTPYQNPLQIALKEWYPANTSATVAGLFPGSFPFNNPNYVVFDGSNIWVSHTVQGGPNQVDKLQASDDKFIGSYKVGGLAGSGSAAYPGAFDGVYIWAPDHATPGTGKVYWIRAADGYSSNTSYCGLGSGQTLVAAAFDGASVWVSTFNGNVVKFDPHTCAVQCSGTVAAGSAIYGLAFDGTNMWATAYNANQVIKLNSSCGGTAINVPTGPVGIVWDGTNLWTANNGDSSISRITGGVVHWPQYYIGYQPSWIAYDGANVWATDASSGRVSKMLASSPYTLSSYPTCGSASSHPEQIAFDGAHMWVACYGTNELGKM